MKKWSLLAAVMMAASFLATFVTALPALACSCDWNGPFFKMAPLSALVVRGKVIGYHGEARGMKLAMDVEVLDVFTGQYNEPEIRIWGGDGMLCLPNVEEFPIGTEWILSLNGPGSKPGFDKGYAISSMCGTFSLRVDKGTVVGNIDNERDREAYQAWPLDEFRKRYRYRLRVAAAEHASLRTAGHYAKFYGRVSSGECFRRPFGEDFCFHLQSTPYGWCITVTDERQTEDISRFTPPLHHRAGRTDRDAGGIVTLLTCCRHGEALDLPVVHVDPGGIGSELAVVEKRTRKLTVVTARTPIGIDHQHFRHILILH